LLIVPAPGLRFGARLLGACGRVGQPGVPGADRLRPHRAVPPFVPLGWFVLVRWVLAGCSASTPAPQGGSRMRRSLSTCPMPSRSGILWSTGSLTCPVLGRRCGPPQGSGHPRGHQVRDQVPAGPPDDHPRPWRHGRRPVSWRSRSPAGVS